MSIVEFTLKNRVKLWELIRDSKDIQQFRHTRVKIFRRDLSTYSIAFSVFIIALLIFTSKIWRQEKQVIYWDVISYYSYLPATFIFNDIRLEKQETLEKGIFWPEKAPNGGNVIKTAMGMSILYSPFFFVGHIAAKITGDTANGFSESYKIAMLIGSFFYLIFSLVFLRKILRSFFTDQISAITILALVLGTNLSFYASREATMPHIYSFALFSIFIWGTIKWHEAPKLSTLILLGSLSGLISLVRPTNILILIFFFFYDISSWKSLQEKVMFFLHHFHWLMLMFLAFILVWVPQFIYWKTVTGKFLYYSYTNESFFFDHPHIFDGLFSYRKGWFVYTPLMLLAIFGIPLMFKYLKRLSWAVSIFIVLNVYVILSWWCWWYGGGFGQRAMIDSYVLLAFPFAVLFNAAKDAGKYVMRATTVIVFLLILHNQFQLEQYKYGSINFDGMTKEAYWDSFGRLHPSGEFWQLLKTPDYDKARNGETEYP